MKSFYNNDIQIFTKHNNTMKRFLLILAAFGLLGLSACTNLEVQADPGTQKEIGFTPVTNLATKSEGPIDGTALPADFDMRVSAYHNAVVTANSQDYFTGVKFAKNASNHWSEHKYWPLSGTLDFLAYACRGLNNASNGIVPTSVTWGDNSKVSEKVVMTVPDNDTKFDDLVYGGVLAKSWSDDNGNGVTINFKHAYAVVMFTFTSTYAPTDWTSNTDNTGIEVTGVTVNGVSYGGPLTITNGATPSASWGTLNAAKTNVAAHMAGTVQLTGTASTAAFGDAYIIIPPQSSASDTYTITYVLHMGKDGDGTTDLNKTLTYTGSFVTTDWEMGKKYVYAVSIQPHEIQVNPTVTDWTTPSPAPAGITVQ